MHIDLRVSRYRSTVIGCIALLLAATPQAGASTEAESFAVRVNVDAAKPIGTLPPIWRFFGADEPNYATQAQGKRLLMELGALAPGQVYFRAHHLLTSGDGTPDFKWGSTNIYTEAAGHAVYDFRIVDAILDTYRANGIHPYLEIGFMPESMTAAPRDVPYRRPWQPGMSYAGITAGWSYPPRDFEKWAELVYRWTRHNVERYGREEVERWYFEVWNEPNLSFYWSGTDQDFYRLHDVAIDAVRRALPTARVGGPDIAGSGGTFIDGFLAHITSGINYATGTIGTPTDFLSFHAKGQPTVVDGHVRMNIAIQLTTVSQAFAKFASVPQLAGKPIIIGENDPEGCAACPGAQNAYRNGTLYSSYTVASYARLWEMARRYHVRLEGALTWAFTFVDQPWFGGFRQLATNGVDLPVLNVFRLFSRLSSEQIETSSSNQVPLEQIVASSVRDAPDVGALATRSTDGRVDVMLWHYRDDDLPGPSANVHVILAGLQAGSNRSARIWRIDDQHGNSFSAWRAMQSPNRPSKRQIARLIQSSHMIPTRIRIDVIGPGAVSLNCGLPLQGVALIELQAPIGSRDRAEPLLP
jgi:xylan 1,4-beta-xylosidase